MRLFSASLRTGLLLWLSFCGSRSSFAQVPAPGRSNLPPWTWATGLRHADLNGYVDGVCSVADSAGNAYVAGNFNGVITLGTIRLTTNFRSNTSLFVGKRSPAGQWLWAQQVGSRNGSAWVAGIALDPQGRVVVAGQYNGPTQFGNGVNLMTDTLHPATNWGGFVARMTPQGQWVSAAGTAQPTPATTNDGVYNLSMTLDALGNAYLTGSFRGALQLGPDSVSAGYDNARTFVAKVTPGGRWRWVVATTTSSGPGGITPSYTIPYQIVLGSGGHLHVAGGFGGDNAIFGTTRLTGFVQTFDYHYHKFVAHLDTAGHWLGAQRMGSYSGTAQLAADAHDNVYATGVFQRNISIGTFRLTALSLNPAGGYSDHFLTRLDSAGTWAWARVVSIGTSFQAAHLATDAARELYMASGNLVRGFDAATGQPGLTSSLGAFLAAEIGTLTVDPRGRLALAGTFVGTTMLAGVPLLGNGSRIDGYHDAFAVTLLPAGQWVADAAQSQTGGVATPVKVVADNRGHVYVAGTFSGTIMLGATTLTSVGLSDVFVAQLSLQGQPLWAARAGGPRTETVRRLAVDAQGNVLVTGHADTLAAFGVATFTKPTDFVARLAPGGQWRWAVPAPAEVRDLAAGGHGAATVAGSFSGTLAAGTLHLTSAGSSDGYVIRLDSAGRYRWGQALGGPGPDSVVAVATDNGGNAVVTGTFQQTITLGPRSFTDTHGMGTLFVAGLTDSGQVRWGQAAQPLRGGSTSNAVALTPAGDYLRLLGGCDSIALGTTHLPPGGFVAALDPATGQWQWSTPYIFSGFSATTDLAVDGQGNAFALLIAGYGAVFGADSIWGRVSPPPPVGPPALPQPFVGQRVGGGPPLPTFFPALAHISSAGQWEWAMGELPACATDSAGHLFVVGSLQTWWDDSLSTFGPLTVRATPQPVGFVAAILDNLILAAPAAVAAPAAALTLYPNPAHGTVQLSTPTGGEAQVLDAVGRVVLTAHLAPGTSPLTLKGLPPGFYTVRVGAVVRRLVVE